MNPYRQCPIYQNENYRIRFVKQSDVNDLLKVYSDPKTVALCNCDNCEDDFYYTSRVRMEQAINYWIMEYHREGFVRWSILDCTSSTAIGTMELFKRSANDAYDNTAVLRLDLLSKYEEQSCLQEILSSVYTGYNQMCTGSRKTQGCIAGNGIFPIKGVAGRLGWHTLSELLSAKAIRGLI